MIATPVLCAAAVLLLAAGIAVGVLISRSRSAALIGTLTAERDAAVAVAAERGQRADADRVKAESLAADLGTQLAGAEATVRESAVLIATLTAERDAAIAAAADRGARADADRVKAESQAADFGSQLAEAEAAARKSAALIATLTAERDAAGDVAAERVERADADREKAELLAADLGTRLTEAEAAVSELNSMRAGLQAREEALSEARIQIEAAQAEAMQLLDAKFAEITNKALAESRTALAAESEAKLSDVNKPVAEMLGRMDAQLKELGEKAVASDARFAEQMNAVVESSRGVALQTQKLASSFHRPQVRGAWGEMHLRRVVEVAGMVEYTDFTIQAHAVSDEGAKLRPDMVVKLAGGRTIVVDSKVSMQAFLDAADADDDAQRAERLKLHAKHVRSHVDNLASKAYSRSVEGAAEFTVLFLATEDALLRAVEHDGALIEYAAGKDVIVATPATLIAMLRVAAQAWTEHATADSAREVLDLGRTLFERLNTFTGHLDKVGQSLDKSVESYNKAVGSLSGRVLVPARKLAEMQVATGDIDTPRTVEQRTREIPSLTSAA